MFSTLFDTSDFPPRWHCGTWTGLHGWTHIVSDILIWAAYASIPIILVYCVRRRRDVPFSNIFLLFALFILSCGFGHLMEAVIFWWPAYRLGAAIKVTTAVASWATVAALIPIVPRALAIPGVLSANESLKAEIVERERVTTALKDREARYAGIIGAAVDAIITIDERGTIDTMNPAAENMFGWSEQELRGKNVSLLMPSPDAERHDGYLQSFCETGVARIIGIGREVEGKRRDGSTFPADLAVSEVKIGGRRLFTGIVRDVTIRKQHEKERLAHEVELRCSNLELEKKNKELDEFTYVASHDLQEPLRKLTSFSSLLRQDAGDKLPERAIQDLEFISGAAKRMECLIQDLLALSRAGRCEQTKAPVALSSCVAGAMQNLSSRIEETGGTVETSDLPTVLGNASLLTQLFQNLIGNALKFRDPERTPHVRVTLEETSEGPVFDVSDNGIGIQPEHAEQIFVPFRRLHGRGKYEGSGIGLSICRKVVERHGGRIWVESGSNGGSHFKFTLHQGTES